MRYIILVFTLFYFINCSTSTGSTTGIDDASNFLSGVALYQNGEIASNEEITIQKIILDSEGYTVEYTETVTTNEDGYYEFENIPDGNYQIISKSKNQNNMVAIKKEISFDKDNRSYTKPIVYGKGRVVIGDIINFEVINLEVDTTLTQPPEPSDDSFMYDEPRSFDDKFRGVKVVLPGLGERELFESGVFTFNDVGEGDHGLGVIRGKEITFVEFSIGVNDPDTIKIDDIIIFEKGLILIKENSDSTISYDTLYHKEIVEDKEINGFDFRYDNEIH